MKSSDQNLGRTELSWPKVTWLYLAIVPSVLFFTHSVSIKWSIVSAVLTLLTVCVGHSVGLHRGIIHKAFKMNKYVRGTLLYLFVQTGLGGPKSWLKLHYIRDYWQNQTTAPAYFMYHHSLLKDYYWNLHLSFKTDDLSRYGIPEEDLNDPWMNFLEQTWYFHVLGLAAVIWLAFGFEAMIISMAVRIALTQLGHWFVGYISHIRGYRNFDIHDVNETGFNNWMLGVFSFGEGFHNNHHACPSSARLGMRWFEIDLGWYVVQLLERLGLIYKVIKNPELVMKTKAEKL
jgi:fatty-acid desaturase